MHERDYLERTIATVRNHRDADNCWPEWANIFADEIERLWTQEARACDRVEAYLREIEDTAASMVGHKANRIIDLVSKLRLPLNREALEQIEQGLEQA